MGFRSDEDAQRAKLEAVQSTLERTQSRVDALEVAVESLQRKLAERPADEAQAEPKGSANDARRPVSLEHFLSSDARARRVQQFFINFGDNSRLNSMGFAPFGLVRNMPVVDTLYNGYGEGAPSGRGPSQGLITSQGNTYLRRDFPQLDYIQSATIVTP